MSLGNNQPSQAATLAARMAGIGRPPQLGPRPISEGPFTSMRGTSGGPALPPSTGQLPTAPGGPAAPPTSNGPAGISSAAELFAALRNHILQRTAAPEPHNQNALMARFLGVS